ncbi:MAG: dTDP-4-dehydrorhamnose reductase [Parcubacteria group bacterium GW2011_GWE2_39_37]|uniref:dTDP-4-dehydrorhamnose reductase n=1 Tax=Candidatus Falkowbacteria bacterium GW2011_GWF2_39_8 TaxID=1618642 RepID=A0A0G0PX05_9BACT|nr:MAG: dTDP-4-dehydrorhamnose reductase [Parcubacteria group bacterium GW2011_GWE2_39_37]KKR32669.1 MAG: dTDP-4-dehydrorhamnose reductase [Candidatus Falkowbacteria bacterium GW2011_GWF2_39_8]
MATNNNMKLPNQVTGAKILILGAKGNLGQQLVRVFSEDTDNEIIAWDRSEIDITDKGLIEKKIKDLKPEIIINAVAFTAVDKCEEEDGYEASKKINGDAVGYLAQAALVNGSMLVHYSTDYIFDGNNESGYKEDDEPDPVNRYGETKLLGEQEIIRLSGRGLKWYIIRTQKLFGPKGESDLSKMSFFDVMLNLSKEREFLDVVDEEEGCFTYTPDLAMMTKKIIDDDYGFGIYHVINPKPVTWYKAAKELFKIAGVKIKVNAISSDKFPRPAKRPKYSALINTKLPKLRTWQQALKEYLNIKK